MYPGLFFPLWDTIHIVARALPHGVLEASQRTDFIKFIEGLLPLVPCPGCSLHARGYLLSHPLNPQTGQEAFEWTIMFHNDVNRRNGKQEYTAKEAEDALEARLAGEFKGLPRAQVIQGEAAKQIKTLKDELRIFHNIPHVVTNEKLQVYLIIVMIVAFVILLLVIVLVVFCAKMQQHIRSFAFMAQPMMV